MSLTTSHSNQLGELEPLYEGPTDKGGNRRFYCQCKNCNRMQLVRKSRLDNTRCRSCVQLKSPCGDLTRSFWEQVKYGAKLRGRDLDITMEYAWKLFLQQGRRCALSGHNLILSPRKGWSTASLDRIDSDKGYVEGNVQWVHKRINKMKTDLPQDEFIRLCQYVASHQEGKHGNY